MRFRGPLLASLLGVACATSGGADKGRAVCERGLCAKLVEKTALGFVVEVTAPAPASLHNAWLARAGGPPCRGGEALNSVADDAGVRMSGPLPLEGTERLRLVFDSVFLSGEALDLDVRFPDGLVCLRLPLKPAPPSDGGATREGGGG